MDLTCFFVYSAFLVFCMGRPFAIQIDLVTISAGRFLSIIMFFSAFGTNLWFRLGRKCLFWIIFFTNPIDSFISIVFDILVSGSLASLFLETIIFLSLFLSLLPLDIWFTFLFVRPYLVIFFSLFVADFLPLALFLPPPRLAFLNRFLLTLTFLIRSGYASKNENDLIVIPYINIFGSYFI